MYGGCGVGLCSLVSIPLGKTMKYRMVKGREEDGFNNVLVTPGVDTEEGAYSA